MLGSLPSKFLFPVACLALAIQCFPVHAQSTAWPRFLGPEGRGYAEDASIPNQWSEGDYAWQLKLAGSGIGSPVIFDNYVYVLNAEPLKSKRSLVAINLGSGEIDWEREFPLEPHPQHARNTFASTTPFVDESGIYVAFGDPGRVTLASVSHEGQVNWQRDLGTWQSQHGFGTSPVMYDGKLILFNSQQADQLNPDEVAGESRMMAFDPANGRTLWSTPLTTTRACYGVPALYTTSSGEKHLIGTNTGDGIFALDLESGKKLWSRKVFGARCVSTPLVISDVVMGTAGSGGGGNHLVALRLTEKDGVMAAEPAFRIDRAAPYVPTPAVVGQRLYMVDDKGIASAVDAKSGEILWSQRLRGGFSASPLVLGSKILMISMDGQATVLETGETFKKLSTFPLGEPVQATPAYADGSLVLRIGNTICCLRGKRI